MTARAAGNAKRAEKAKGRQRTEAGTFEPVADHGDQPVGGLAQTRQARAVRPSKDERRMLALVAQAIEGEGPDAGGVGPVLRAVAHLAEHMGKRLGVDVSALVAEPLEAGRQVYGPLDLVTDPRDFIREALEELADATVYLGAAVLLGEQRRHNGSTQRA